MAKVKNLHTPVQRTVTRKGATSALTTATPGALAPIDPAKLKKAAGRYDANEVRDVAAEFQKGGLGWPLLSPRNGVFTYAQQLLGKSLPVVVLAATRLNEYYKLPWDPSNPTPPDCQAVMPLGGKERDMAPPEGFDGVSALCATCPMNQFDSAGKGRRGKACTNYTRLAVVNASFLDGQPATPAVARVAPTSAKTWGLYLNYLATQEIPLPVNGVVTMLHLGGAIGNAPFSWQFECLDVLDEKQSKQLAELQAEAESEVQRITLRDML